MPFNQSSRRKLRAPHARRTLRARSLALAPLGLPVGQWRLRAERQLLGPNRARIPGTLTLLAEVVPLGSGR